MLLREKTLYSTGLPGLTPGKPGGSSFSPPSQPPHATPPRHLHQAPFLPDNVVVVSQEEFLAVLAGVVNHSDPSHKVDHLLAGRVVQVVAALVTPVPVDPLQPELAAGSRPIRHDKPTPLAPRPPRAPVRGPCAPGLSSPRSGLRRACKGSGYSAER